MAHTRDFLIGVFVGSLVGAAAALLYAPYSGADTRRILKEKSDEARDQAGHLVGEVREKSGRAVHRAHEGLEHLRDEAKSRAEELTHDAREIVTKAKETVTHGREAIERQKSALASAVAAGRQAYVEKTGELAGDAAPAETAG